MAFTPMLRRELTLTNEYLSDKLICYHEAKLEKVIDGIATRPS